LRKILLESFVIVGSILVAFGIDAAWAIRQDREAEDELLRSLVDEMNANAEELELRRAQGSAAFEAQLKLIDLIGPGGAGLSVDSLGSLIRRSMSFGTVEVESAALEAVLTGVASRDASRANLLRLLRRYLTELEDHRLEDRRQWIDSRVAIKEHLIEESPFAFVWAEYVGHSRTDFDVPVATLLRDERFEGLVSALSVRNVQMT